MAICLPNSPVNEVAVINLQSKRGWFIAHPNYRVKLAHPSFSPDGRKLALVVTPPTYFGISEIWVTSPEGGDAAVIKSEPARCFMLPVFSRDSARIVCFAEMLGQGTESGRSYRTGLVHLGLAEVALQAREITPITETAWSWVSYVGYDRNDQGFFLRTGEPSDRIVENGVVHWRRSRLDHENFSERKRGLNAYYIERGKEPGELPVSVLPRGSSPVARNAPALMGVDSSGRLLYLDNLPNAQSPNGSASALLIWNGAEVHQALAPDFASLQDGAISFDGQVTVGRITRDFIRSESSVPANESTYLIGGLMRDPTLLNIDRDITFDRVRKNITPVNPSELAR
ncbi:MAG: hypothetical protein ABW199_08495 [Caulobacterales bacterium]